MRCPQENKFVSFADPEVELEDENVDDDGSYTATLTVKLPCAECGETLKEAALDIEATFEHECPLIAGGEYAESDQSYTITASDVEPTAHLETERNGKPLNRRAQRQYYGGTVTVTLACELCEADEAFTIEQEEQASAFEEVA